MNKAGWNPWHGCHKLSEGCKYCFMHTSDLRHGRDPELVCKSSSAFDLPLRKDRNGFWKIPPGTEVAVCFTSDFFLEEADLWRDEAWSIIRFREDLRFLIATKRVERIGQCLPADWGEGWEHVMIAVSCENQRRADERLRLFSKVPCKHKAVFAAPLLEPIDFRVWFSQTRIELVSVSGENGRYARPCRFEWIERIYQDAKANGVAFSFHQTGTHFVKDNILYTIRRMDQFSQAKKATCYLAQKKR